LRNDTENFRLLNFRLVMAGTVAPLQSSYQKRYAGDLAPGSLERMRDFRPEIVRRAIGVLPASGKPTPRTSIDRLVNRMPKACLCRAGRSNRRRNRRDES
jgi:hypothetical protein